MRPQSDAHVHAAMTKSFRENVSGIRGNKHPLEVNDENGVPLERVDAVDQLAMSLQWDDEYSDSYKRNVIINSVIEVLSGRISR